MALTWDGYAIDPLARRLSGPDGDIHVEPQVFDVLALLVEERDRVIPKAEIMDRVWGDQFISESALTTRIKQARRSLGDDGRTQRYIRNVHGRGYQFVGAIDDGPASVAPRSGPAEAPASSSDAVAALARDIAVDDDFPFVGREEELTRGAEALGVDRSGATVVISGQPGVGKSRLAVELLERAAEAGARVAAGRCEMQMTSALQAIRDAFGQLAATDPAAVGEWSAGIEGPLLALIPSLTAHLGHHQPVPVDAYGGIDVFLTALDRLSATGPVVLLVDDLQWSDEPTRTFLDRVERRLAERPIRVVLTHRVGRSDLPADVARWIARRSRAEATVAIELGGLGAQPARQLVEAVLEDASADDVEELISLTDANCLFLTETLRDASYGRRGAHSVAELIVARLDRQDDTVGRIITAGAALGPEFPFAVAAGAAGLDRVDALAAIDRAIDAELIHETASSTRFRFSHQLIPESIVDRLGRAERAALHQRCADALADEGATEAEVVLHQLRAIPLVPVDEAVERARTTATAARDANQFDLAIRILRLAAEAEPPARIRAEIQLELAQIINQLGTPAEAIEGLERLVESARANGWADLLVAASLAHWSMSPYRRPSDVSTMALLEEADALLGEVSSVDKALVVAKTASFSVFTRRLDERGQLADRALAMARAEGAGPEELLTVLECAAIAFTCPAGADRLDELEPEILSLREATGLTYFRDAAAPESLALLRADGEGFRRAADRDPARVAAQPIAEWRDLTLRATLSAFAGDIADARDRTDRAAEIGEAFWGESAHSLHGFGHFFLDLISGQWTRSKEILELLVTFSAEAVFIGPYALALHHAGADDDRVVELSDRIGERQIRSFAEHIVGGNALIGCGELALARDDDRLADLVEPALVRFQHLMLGLPWAATLAAADTLARLAERRGDEAKAAEARKTAASVYRRLDAPALLARVDS